jgi:ADP-ribose pyrophosphatase
VKKPTVQSSKMIFEGFFSLKQDTLLRADGHPYTLLSLQLNTDAAIILAQDTQERYILNREYRHATKEVLLGCPGGRREPGEEILECGRRELVEETGYVAGQIDLIGTCYPFPGVCDQKIFFLWARGCEKKHKQHLDPGELIETELKTEQELYHEMRTSDRIDGLLAAALWYKTLFTQLG